MKRLFLMLLTVMMLILSACSGTIALEGGGLQARPIEERLKYAPVAAATDTALVTLPAWVTTNPGSRFELSPPAAAKIVALLVQEGSQLKAGDPLARLQVPSLTGRAGIEAAAKQRVKAAEARLKIEREKLELGLGTKTGVEDAQADIASATLDLKQLEATREAAESSGLSRDGQGALTLLWRAPRAGVLTRIHVREGQGVGPEDTAFSLVDSGGVEVAVRVPERLLPSLDQETRLQWRPSGLAQSDPGLTLALVRRDTVIDPQSRTAVWYFSGQPADSADHRFIPGRSGRGTLLADAGAGLWLVPRQAVCKLSGKNGVFVAGDDLSKPHFEEVEVIGRLGEDLVLRADGFQVTTRVVVAGTFLLKSIKLLSEES